METSVHPALDEVALASAVQTGRLRVFNERSIIGAISASAGIALLGWVLWASAGPTSAISLSILACIVEGSILWVAWNCRRALAGHGRPQFWMRMHFGVAALAGVAWGSAVWFVWTEGDIRSYLATLTILMGVAGVSMVTMSSYATASVLFFGGLYLTPLLHASLHPSPEATFIQVGLLLGLLVQIGYTRELGRVVLRDVEQSARNAALVDRLNELVIHDPLTGAGSRRYTFEQMEQLVSIRQRYGTSASAIMFDLDHFKVINDTYGHPTGDRALQETVRAVGTQLRDGELLGRIGGEEFLVLLPSTNMAAAQPLAERLRQTLAATSIVDGTHTIALPASFGIAELQAAESQAEWFRRVDGALYQAKKQGRNQVIAAE
jgi:diguanylate cyclase (GGDEF)-like protein|nr:GGDEF domain-containing protein [Rhodoferax sp.]